MIPALAGCVLGGHPWVAMIPDDLDLVSLAEELKSELKPGDPVGYLRGKSLMRDVLVHDHAYSELEAEELIDTLESRGYLHFLGDPADRSKVDTHWEIAP